MPRFKCQKCGRSWDVWIRPDTCPVCGGKLVWVRDTTKEGVKKKWIKI